MGYLGRVPVAERSGLPMAMKLPAFTNAMRTFARPGVGRGGARALDLALARLYAAFDESGTGLVDATELAAGLARLSAQLGASRVKAAFRMFAGAGGADDTAAGWVEPSHAKVEDFEAFLRSMYERLYAALPRHAHAGVGHAACAERAAHAAACTAFPQLVDPTARGGGDRAALLAEAARRDRFRTGGARLNFSAFRQWMRGAGKDVCEVAMHLHERTNRSPPSSASGRPRSGSARPGTRERLATAASVRPRSAARARVHLTPPPSAVLAAIAQASAHGAGVEFVLGQMYRLCLGGLTHTTVWRGAARLSPADVRHRRQAGGGGGGKSLVLAKMAWARARRAEGRIGEAGGTLRLSVHDPMRPSPARAVAAEFLAWASPSAAKGASLNVALCDVRRCAGGLERAAAQRWEGLRHGDATDVKWLLRHLTLVRSAVGSLPGEGARVAALAWRDDDEEGEE